MVQLVAKMAFPYAGRSLKPGDRFEASERDAKILKGGRRADDAEEEAPQPKRRRYNRRDMVASD